VKDINSNVSSIGFSNKVTSRHAAQIDVIDQMNAVLTKRTNIVFAYSGHPGFCSTSAKLVAKTAESMGYEVRMIPGISSLDCLLSELQIDACETGLHVFDGIQLLLGQLTLSKYVPAVIFQPRDLISDQFRSPGISALELFKERIRITHGIGHFIVLYEHLCDDRHKPQIKEIAIAGLQEGDLTENTLLYIPASEWHIPGPDILSQYPTLVSTLSGSIAKQLRRKIN
jgi:precorrin-6B methylase 1